MNVTQVSIGRFHHFHLARQMEKFGILDRIFTGYPKFKLKDEQGIDQNKIKTFPWVHAPFMMRGNFGLDKYDNLTKEWINLDVKSLDSYVASKLTEPTILVALSCSASKAGKLNQSRGGVHICDRGSSHIQFQNEILKEEYKKWNLSYIGTDERIIQREMMEYQSANFITVPSQFVYNSFIEKGISADKLRKIPYGANLSRFSKIAEPEKNSFSVLWVGQVSIRKGFLYALEAFLQLKVSNKKFTVIGSVEPALKELIKNKSLENVIFKGNVPNNELVNYYNSHHVFVLTSLEEGLAMVQGEALASGCPIIATPNSGCEDLIENGREGFIVPIRDVQAVKEAFEKFLDSPSLREELSTNALSKIKSSKGWDDYGEKFYSFIKPFSLLDKYIK